MGGSQPGSSHPPPPASQLPRSLQTSPWVGTRIPPPPTLSQPSPSTRRVRPGTGAAQETDCPLCLRQMHFCHPPSRESHTIPPALLPMGWVALRLPGKRGSPSRVHPFLLCFPPHAQYCPRAQSMLFSLPSMQEGVTCHPSGILRGMARRAGGTAGDTERSTGGGTQLTAPQ